MTTSHFCLSSNTYKNRVFEGFSRLQQNDEFVDMTLAAEGYLVKVHRTLIVLASPFLKELLSSAPCQHPVLFLSNISHKVLCYILEYIYTGEVNIPSGDVRTFLNAAQDMHITGLENIIPPPSGEESMEEVMAKQVFYKPRPSNTHDKACITISDKNIVIPPVKKSREEYPTMYATDRTSSSAAPAKPYITITGVQNMPSTSENETRNSERVSHIFHSRPVPANAITINPDFNLNINQSNENDVNKQNLEIVSLPMTTPVSEEIGEFLSFIDNKTVKATGQRNGNIGNTSTNDSIRHDPSNMKMFSNITNENINSIPMIIEGHSSLYPGQILNNIDNGVSATIDCHNNNDNVLSNAPSNSQTDFSSLLNISNSSLIQADHDMAVDISISDLLDCEHVATPGTNEIDEYSAMNKKDTIKLAECGNLLSPLEGKETDEENVVNKVQLDLVTIGDCVEPSDTPNEIAFLNQDEVNSIYSKDPATILYTVSNRGSMIMIMNHFMYYCHHIRDKGRRRRWRCIDYRSLRCKASFDTQNDIILARTHKHSHPNHEEKIYFKIMRRKVFATIDVAQKAAKHKNSLSEAVTDEDV